VYMACVPGGALCFFNKVFITYKKNTFLESLFLLNSRCFSKFFFDKSKYYIKKRRGAQPLVHWEYTKGTREREKKRKENLQS
jgi:hypothetical protein